GVIRVVASYRLPVSSSAAGGSTTGSMSLRLSCRPCDGDALMNESRLTACGWLGLMVVAWAAVAGLAGTARAEAGRPNVVFIMADDLGWSDTTLHGTTRLYQTPHIERLAERGLRFTQAYAASPLCSPTRASIMTGQYPGRVGITGAVCHLPE